MNKTPWLWVPTLYLYQGIPYSIVMTTSALFYQSMGINVASFTFWTSLLYLPWTIKPLWSPLVEAYSTKRHWVTMAQMLVAVLFLALGLSFQSTWFYPLSLLTLLFIALGSASHDIACDGFYMLALNTKEQSFFVGIRTVFYKIAMLAALGLIPIIVDTVNTTENNTSWGWTVAFTALGAVMLLLWLFNKHTLPHPTDTTSNNAHSLSIYKEVIVSFFSKPGVLPAIGFLLLYRLGEAQLAKIATPFLIDDRANGGLGMSMTDYGIAYGTLGMIALTIGGVVGGWMASKYGLKRLIWPMVAFMNIPNLVYVALAIWQPASDSATIYAAIITEQLGYGFGFTAYMLFLLQYVGDSKYKTAEYALGTALMALGMMLPGMISGFIQEAIGYEWFFIYVVICCIPGTILAKYLHL